MIRDVFLRSSYCVRAALSTLLLAISAKSGMFVVQRAFTDGNAFCPLISGRVVFQPHGHYASGRAKEDVCQHPVNLVNLGRRP